MNIPEFLVVRPEPQQGAEAPQGGPQGAAPTVQRGDQGPAGEPTPGVAQPNGSGNEQPPGTSPENCLATQWPLLLGMVAIMYFLIIRPSQKQEKKRRQTIASAKRGDQIVTTGGLHGTVTALTDDSVTIEVDRDVKLTFDRAAIGRVVGTDDAPSKPS